MALWGIAVMVGPVLGPVLGGWLTENYTWRWVFYINLPLGALAFLGISTFLPETARNAGAKLDWFGFGTLSLGIGALQVLLDRGEQLDWFGSGEIWIEAIIAASAFYLFVAHTFTADEPFVRPALFRDRNFAAGMIFIFIVGVTYLASLALLTPYLQSLMNYPIVTAGLVLGPRGIGTMAAMLRSKSSRTMRRSWPACAQSSWSLRATPTGTMISKSSSRTSIALRRSAPTAIGSPSNGVACSPKRRRPKMTPADSMRQDWPTTIASSPPSASRSGGRESSEILIRNSPLAKRPPGR